MEKINFTPELISKAKTAKSAEELIKIAEGEGVKLDEKTAAFYFDKMNQPVKELADEELDSVAGGGCGEKPDTHPWVSFHWSCEHQQDAVWDPMWQGDCCICIYSGADDDRREMVRCYYPDRVRYN